MPANIKALAEKTLAKAYEICQKHATPGGYVAESHFAAFQAYCDAWEAATGDEVPRGLADFKAFATARANGDASATGLRNELVAGSPHPGGGKSTLRFFDDRGRCVRGLGSQESFRAAIQEQAAEGGEGAAEFKEGAKLAADGLTLGSMCRALVFGPETSAERMAVSGGGGGGYMIPSVLAADFIDALRRRAVLNRLGVTVLPMTTEGMQIARITGDATASWRRETTTVAESEPTFGAQNFHAKSLSVIVKCSREALEDAAMIGTAIERSLTESFAIEVDRAGLLGEGGAAPVGLANFEGINTETGIGAITDYKDVLAAYRKILDDNAPEPTGLVISNREWQAFAGLEDTTGQPLRKPPAIESLPMLPTSAISITAGGGTESSAFLGYWPDLILAMRAEMRIEMLKELYAGTLEVGFLAHLRMDTGIMHPESFCAMTGITP
jgi:HK97 family phage major capsid protein